MWKLQYFPGCKIRNVAYLWVTRLSESTAEEEEDCCKAENLFRVLVAGRLPASEPGDSNINTNYISALLTTDSIHEIQKTSVLETYLNLRVWCWCLHCCPYPKWWMCPYHRGPSTDCWSRAQNSEREFQLTHFLQCCSQETLTGTSAVL